MLNFLIPFPPSFSLIFFFSFFYSSPTFCLGPVHKEVMTRGYFFMVSFPPFLSQKRGSPVGPARSLEFFLIPASFVPGILLRDRFVNFCLAPPFSLLSGQ